VCRHGIAREREPVLYIITRSLLLDNSNWKLLHTRSIQTKHFRVIITFPPLKQKKRKTIKKVTCLLFKRCYALGALRNIHLCSPSGTLSFYPLSFHKDISFFFFTKTSCINIYISNNTTKFHALLILKHPSFEEVFCSLQIYFPQSYLILLTSAFQEYARKKFRKKPFYVDLQIFNQLIANCSKEYEPLYLLYHCIIYFSW
jgi:hypothetical protein